jgi:hypothetical protein
MAFSGPRKKVGPQGPKGDTPDHEWSGTRLRFENPDGTWGDFTDLKGPKGKDGKQGERGPPGPPGANGRNGVGVPTGGTTGQVLTKASNGNYDTFWSTVSGGGGGIATQAPKLIVTFDTDSTTAVRDLVYVTGQDFVSTIPNNSGLIIPNGIFGVCITKPTVTEAEILFFGIVGGFSSLNIGLPVFVSPIGVPTQTLPNTGIVQQIGFAVSATEIFFNIMSPIGQV